MSTEAIAKVVADLVQSGKVARGDLNEQPRVTRRHSDFDLYQLSARCIFRPVVVDATAIYHSLVAKDEPIYLYEDHPCVAPPFFEFAITYENEHGNVIVMHCMALDADAGMTLTPWSTNTRPEDEVVDWSQVRWTVRAIFWAGGKTEKTVPAPTFGPVHIEELAVGRSGELLDIHWMQVIGGEEETAKQLRQWEMARLVLLGTLNFMNCRNVEVVDTPLPRSTRRRIERESPGITVKELNVFPVGKRYAAGTKNAGAGQGVALHSVRGHFAHYGNCCPGSHEPRGLLFGKLAGRYFVAQHARGSAEHGTVEKTYTMKPEETHHA